MEKFNNKKNRNLDYLKFIGKYVSNDRFERIKNCGSFLQFISDETFENQRLYKAFFCGDRFCPYCNFRRSRRQAVQISTILRYLKSKQYEFLFLTLTAPNVKADELKNEIEKYSKAFSKMMKRKQFKDSFLGYVKNLEITYNRKMDSYHPHLHVILCVNKSYFTNPKKYISKSSFLKFWQQAMNDDNITQVDIRKVNTDDFKAISEISKYTTKDSDYLLNKNVFDVFYKSLKNKNSVSYGGEFKEACKLYKAGKLDYLKDQDLNNYVYLIEYVWGVKEYQINNLIELSNEEKEYINKKYRHVDTIKEVENDL